MNSTTTISYTCSGDILSTNADAVREEVNHLIDRAESLETLHLDLRASRIVDSVGLNLIVSIIRKARSRNADVRISIANNAIRRIMAFTRIDQHAEVVSF